MTAASTITVQECHRVPLQFALPVETDRPLTLVTRQIEAQAGDVGVTLIRDVSEPLPTILVDLEFNGRPTVGIHTSDKGLSLEITATAIANLAIALLAALEEAKQLPGFLPATTATPNDR